MANGIERNIHFLAFYLFFFSFTNLGFDSMAAKWIALSPTSCSDSIFWQLLVRFRNMKINSNEDWTVLFIWKFQNENLFVHEIIMKLFTMDQINVWGKRSTFSTLNVECRTLHLLSQKKNCCITAFILKLKIKLIYLKCRKWNEVSSVTKRLTVSNLSDFWCRRWG